MPLFSVVIPVYKGEACFAELNRRLVLALEQITEDFEILYVEDCGGDNSWQLICEHAQADPRVKGFRLSRNFGQHPAITAGLDQAKGEWIVVMDCDLQDDPACIPQLYAKAQEGFDVVLARRIARKDSLNKRITGKMFYAVFSYLAGYKDDGAVGSYRLFSRKVLRAFYMFREQLRAISPLTRWMGFRVAYVEVPHSARFSGKSSYNMRRLVKLASDVIVAFSDKPLRLSIKIGFFVSSFALLFGVYHIGRAILSGVAVPGWASLITSLYLLSGIIIMNLGVIGIYLARVYDEVKRRPLYLIGETTVAGTPVFEVTPGREQ